MLNMNLRYVGRVDFRKSERTNFEAVAKKLPVQWREDDVVCFISTRGDQLVFVHGFHKGLIDKRGNDRVCLESVRLRLTSGTWSELMLANYAKEVGITLRGIKTFEQHLADFAKKALRVPR